MRAATFMCGVLLLAGTIVPGAAIQNDTRQRLQAAVDGFKAPDLHGREISMPPLRGRVVLLEFWATWCAPCLSDIPWLQKARTRHPDRFEVVGVSLDVIDRAAFTSWLRRHRITWRQVHDGRGWSSPIIDPFGFERIPFNVLVGPDGRVIGTDVRGEALLQTLDVLLGASAVDSTDGSIADETIPSGR